VNRRLRERMSVWLSGLGARASLLFLAGVLATGLGFYGVLVSSTRNWLVAELDDRMRSATVASGERLRVPLAFRDRRELASALRDLVAESDVVGAVVHDADGRRVMARAARAGEWSRARWSPPPPPPFGGAPDPVRIVDAHAGAGRHVREYLVPIVGASGPSAPDADETAELFGLAVPTTGSRAPAAEAQLGWLRVAVSTERVERLVATAARSGVIVLAVALVLGLVVASNLMRIVVRPLGEAGELAREIADGDLSRRLPVRGRDELGSLAVSLNRMADAIATARRQTALEAAHLRNSTRAVIGVARQARRVTDPRRAFEIVSTHARALSGCELVALAVPDEAGPDLHVEYADTAPELGPVPLTCAIAPADVLSSCEGVPAGRRLEIAAGGAIGRVLAGVGLTTAFTVALPRPDGTVAVLLLAARDPECFQDWHLDVIDAIASHLSGALDTAQLRERLEGAFAELERTRDSLLQAQNLRMASEIASGAAHDFNNVLSAILGRAQLLRRQQQAGTLEDGALLRSLEVMEAAARDGSDTVRRLNEFGRGGGGTVVEVVDVAAALRDAAEFTRFRWEAEAQAEGRMINLTLDAAPGVHVLARLSEVRDVFSNLILNAADALTGGGAITLEVRADGGDAVIVVRDDGVGMSSEVRGRVFEPFFTTKGTGGSGLGLSVVYGIVTRARGTIELTSEPGAGARFELRFPLAEPAAADVAASPAESAAAASHSLSILVVDDENPVREVIVDILKALGHRPEDSATPAVVAATYAPGRYDLVLTDIGMPVMNGWALAREIRARDPQVMVALVTGWGEQIEASAVDDAGADAVVPKPFTVDDLNRVCAAAWKRRSAAA
jgi:signal transduction histidine kinase/CheY-like chemotaxis protein